MTNPPATTTQGTWRETTTHTASAGRHVERVPLTLAHLRDLCTLATRIGTPDNTPLLVGRTTQATLWADLATIETATFRSITPA